MSDLNHKAQLEFEKALALRNFEIESFWKRGWFFGALVLALGAAYYQTRTQENEFVNPACISFLATIIVLCQCLINRGGKYWQERWEYVTFNREATLGVNITKPGVFEGNPEKEYIDAAILAQGENCLTRAHRFSVSKLAFLVWDIISIACGLVWVRDVVQIFCKGEMSWEVGVFHGIIIVYVVLFLWKGKVFQKYSRQKILDRAADRYLTNNPFNTGDAA